MRVINPESGREILIGGPTYKRLVRLGKIKPKKSDKKISPKTAKLSPKQADLFLYKNNGGEVR